MMARLRTGQAAHRARDGRAGARRRRRGRRAGRVDHGRRRARAGSSAPAPTSRPQVAAFAAQHGVDEVMISPVAGAFDGEPMDAATGRVQTLELLAA